ncbi:hypothetical protein Pst134EA_031749 [Puccinia striiformis f. sp. tritici]|uniref:uncharacterized protein n=1 Tax=Puccinia striiformis f. sp. tritici TaxID=168172 RepID=UPI0020078821|nr:uncharacterized protein Pst134EA_031749 [Puccinia striiformis f. sp. tritici]KAH9442634.1 hypothetical protein Pst134EA_031749 [Puccinia striiformis f. sp. tritici]
MWLSMRREKKEIDDPLRECGLLPFDDEESPLDYGANILDTEPTEAIQTDLDEEEDAPDLDWFYDHKPLTKKYKATNTSMVRAISSRQLDLGMMSRLYHIGRNLFSDFHRQ